MNHKRIVSFTLLFLALAVIPASAQVLYTNGPINGTVNSWTISFGYVVSDSFTVPYDVSLITGFDIGVWEYPGDRALTVDWSITSEENGGISLGSGTAEVADTFVSTNQFGFDIDTLTVSGVAVLVPSGNTYWLNIQNATTQFGNPVYWDENSGPSLASDSAVGTIASEAFDVIGASYCQDECTPEPGTITLFGSGVLGLAGMLRRKLF